MADTKHFGVFSVATNELLATASGPFEDVLHHYENPEVVIFEGEYTPHWKLVGGVPAIQSTPPVAWFKARLIPRIKMERELARQGLLTTTFGETQLDLALMAIAPRTGSVQWRFSTGPVTLTQNQWRQFLDEIWDHIILADNLEITRLNTVATATTHAQLQALIDLLLPETLL